LRARNEEAVSVLLRQGPPFLPKFRAGLPNPVDTTVQFVRGAVGRGEITSSDAEFARRWRSAKRQREAGELYRVIHFATHAALGQISGMDFAS
jgi:hypothetical protein